MESRVLGQTGLQVTPLGLGLAGLGRPGYLAVGHSVDLPDDRSVDSLRTRTWEMLDHAARLGIGYLDVARSYGRGEEFLGGWLEANPAAAGQMTVGSKWGYEYTAGWQADAAEHEVKDHSLATFTRQLDESWRHLGDRLDLYQVHSATLDSGLLDDAAALDALGELAASGVVVGLSVSGPRQADTLERALDLAATGRAPFSVVQATWNLLEPSAGPALAAAHDAGWGVIIKEAVANGRLTDRGDAPATVRAVASDLGIGIDQLAIAAALAQPYSSVVLSGAVTIQQLDANVAALGVSFGSDHLEAALATPLPVERYWTERSALPWT